MRPGFAFLVGVPLPVLDSRPRQEGRVSVFHFPRIPSGEASSLWRSIIFPAPHRKRAGQLRFEAAGRIGLGYAGPSPGVPPPSWQWTAFGALLFGYWLAWALYPAPGPGFNYAAVGVPADWHHNFTGFASHWSIGDQSRPGDGRLDCPRRSPRGHPRFSADEGRMSRSFKTHPPLGAPFFSVSAPVIGSLIATKSPIRQPPRSPGSACKVAGRASLSLRSAPSVRRIYGAQAGRSSAESLFLLPRRHSPWIIDAMTMSTGPRSLVRGQYGRACVSDRAHCGEISYNRRPACSISNVRSSGCWRPVWSR